VDLGHFSRPLPRPEPFAGIDRPIALYVGALRDWFDWGLLRRVCELAPDIEFVIVSPDPPHPKCEALGNFTYLPGVPYEKIPAYYQHASVGVIPFKDSALVGPVNPIKLVECLASGTPVVATEWEELKNNRAPVELARGPENFHAAIGRAIENGMPPSAKSFVAGRSWESNVDRLLERIAEIRSPNSND
jgi:glycosyltransferase involved in cell wall biosynthesis